MCSECSLVAKNVSNVPLNPVDTQSKIGGREPTREVPHSSQGYIRFFEL